MKKTLISIVGLLLPFAASAFQDNSYDTNSQAAANAYVQALVSGPTNGITLLAATNVANASALAATNNFGRTVAVNMTNQANLFTGNGGGLTNYQATNLNNGGSSSGQILTATTAGVTWSNAPAGGTSTTNFNNINVTNTATIGTVQSDNYLDVPGIYYVGGLNSDFIDLGRGIFIQSGYASLNLNGGNGTVSTENDTLDDGSGNSVWPFVGNNGTTITIGADPNSGSFPAIYMTDGNGDPFFEVYDGSGGGGSAYMKFIDNSEGLSLVFVGEGILDGNNNHPLLGWDGTTITLGNAGQQVVTTDNTLDDGSGNATFKGGITATNGIASYATNIVASASANGYTNTSGINMVANISGTSGTYVFLNRSGTNGTVVCGTSLFTNTVLTTGSTLPVPVNCGIHVVSGVGVEIQVYAN